MTHGDCGEWDGDANAKGFLGTQVWDGALGGED